MVPRLPGSVQKHTFLVQVFWKTSTLSGGGHKGYDGDGLFNLARNKERTVSIVQEGEVRDELGLNLETWQNTLAKGFHFTLNITHFLK